MGRLRLALSFCAMATAAFLVGMASPNWFLRSDQLMGGTRRVLETPTSPPPKPPQGPIHIKATGHKFFWRFSFCGPDQKFGTSDDVVVNKIAHLPLNRDVQLSVESEDYVYSFYVPTLQLRHVAVPEL